LYGIGFPWCEAWRVLGDSIIVARVPGATSLRLLASLCWSLGREVGQPEGLQSREGGTLPWVVHAEGDESVFGIVVGVWYIGLAIVCIDCYTLVGLGRFFLGGVIAPTWG
jgi:hypothetical protein